MLLASWGCWWPLSRELGSHKSCSGFKAKATGNLIHSRHPQLNVAFLSHSGPIALGLSSCLSESLSSPLPPAPCSWITTLIIFTWDVLFSCRLFHSVSSAQWEWSGHAWILAGTQCRLAPWHLHQASLCFVSQEPSDHLFLSFFLHSNVSNSSLCHSLKYNFVSGLGLSQSLEK